MTDTENTAISSNSRNKRDASISAKHKANRAARAAKRKAYWATELGKARKAAKMSTDAKLQKAEKWRRDRDVRRRERKLAEQQAKTAEAAAQPAS